MAIKRLFRIVSGALLVALTVFTFIQQPAYAQGVSVTVCHAAGPSQYVPITVSISSVNDANGLNGHGNHANDAWPSFVFDGVTYPGRGDPSNCSTATDPDPVDVCPNLDGDQATLPDGYEFDELDQCVLINEDPVDVCPNLDGDQATLPDGYEFDEQDQCVLIDEETTDLCPNIDGDQASIPDGYIVDGQGLCVPDQPDEPEDPGDPGDPPVTSTIPFLIPVTGVEGIDSGQLLLNLSGLGAGLALLVKGLFGKEK